MKHTVGCMRAAGYGSKIFCYLMYKALPTGRLILVGSIKMDGYTSVYDMLIYRLQVNKVVKGYQYYWYMVHWLHLSGVSDSFFFPDVRFTFRCV